MSPSSVPQPADVETIGTALRHWEPCSSAPQCMGSESNDVLDELTIAHKESLQQLALAVESREGHSVLHLVRVGFIAEAMAHLTNQPREFAVALRQVAPMHDVGKIGVPESLLKKRGPLTPEERREVNKHPQTGAQILGKSRLPLFQLAAEVALTHHERMDGYGYPLRLKGDAIPMSGRIMALVDCFDALTSERPYRQAFSDIQAIRKMQEESGIRLDPVLVETFVKHSELLLWIRNEVNRRLLGLDSLSHLSCMDLCQGFPKLPPQWRSGTQMR